MKASLLRHREETSLVDVFTIEILVVFVESLALAHVDDKSLGQCYFVSIIISHCSYFWGHLDLFRYILKQCNEVVAESKSNFKINFLC